MYVKGITVTNIRKYIKENFAEQYDLWFDSLPEVSKEIYKSTLFADKLYPIKDAIIYPTEKTGEIFFDGDVKLAAYEMGFDSAEKALKSIYKIFLKISSLNFIIKKAKSLYSSFYSEGNIEIIGKYSDKLVLSLSEIYEDEKLNIIRISGWIDGFLTGIGRQPAKVNYNYKEKNDFIIGEITVIWKSEQKY